MRGLRVPTFTVETPFEDAVIETVLGPTGNPRLHIAKSNGEVILSKIPRARDEHLRTSANWSTNYVCKYFTGREPELMIIP